MELDNSAAHYVEEKGHLWFFHLKNNSSKRDSGLEGFYGADRLAEGGVLIARDHMGKHGIIKRFALFQSYDDVINHIDHWPLKDRNFYEIIDGVQKPYFDIDIPTHLLLPFKNERENLRNRAMKIVYGIAACIQAAARQWGHRIGDGQLHIFETCYPVDEATGYPSKFSFHLVLQGLAFTNHTIMNAFGQDVKDLVYVQTGDVVANFIDEIWSSGRQFRLFGSSKLGSDATKMRLLTPDHHWPFLISNQDSVDFKSTFVTNTAGCIIIDKINSRSNA